MSLTALITGASSGLGLALAETAARNGYDLILVSSSLKNLEEAAEKIKKESSCRSVCLIEQDLSRPNAAGKVMSQISQPVDLLINNAGTGRIGPYVSQCLEDIQKMNQLNVQTPMEFCLLLAQNMTERKKGQILNVCSIGAFTPGPYTAQYYATKSALCSFSLALRDELKSSSVNVCAYCPGTIRTGFFEKAGGSAQGPGMSPQQAAAAAWKGLQKNRGIIFASRLQQASLLIPAAVRQKIIGKMKQKSMKTGSKKGKAV